MDNFIKVILKITNKFLGKKDRTVLISSGFTSDLWGRNLGTRRNRAYLNQFEIYLFPWTAAFLISIT